MVGKARRAPQRAGARAGFTTRRHLGGSGVGLTVSREVLNTLGGTISFCSAVPYGTVVTILLSIDHDHSGNL